MSIASHWNDYAIADRALLRLSLFVSAAIVCAIVGRENLAHKNGRDFGISAPICAPMLLGSSLNKVE